MSKLKDFKEGFKTFQETLRNDLLVINNRVEKVEKSQEFLSNQYDNHSKVQKYIQSSCVAIEKSHDHLRMKLISLEKALALEKIKSNDQENRNRKMNVEISGIPVKSNENCKTIVKEISNFLSTDLLLSDIDVAHRLTSSNTKIPPNHCSLLYTYS